MMWNMLWERSGEAAAVPQPAGVGRWLGAAVAAGGLLLTVPMPVSRAAARPCGPGWATGGAAGWPVPPGETADPASAVRELPPDTPDVREFLRRAERRYGELESLRARFHQGVEVTLLDRRREGEGTWYQKGRGRFKMEFEEPPGDVIVADGSHVWLYYPSTHPGQVIRSEIEASTTGRGMVDLQGRIFEEARHGYSARDGGTMEVSGVTARLVILTPTGPSPYRRVRVWVGTDDLLVRKFEITEENETVRTVRLWSLEPDATIPDSVFDFEVPPGVEVFGG